MLKAAILLVGCLVTLTFGFPPIGNPDDVPGFNPDLDAIWVKYVKAYNKTYQDESEKSYRRYIWEDNLATITRHNKEAELGMHTYNMGLNDFTDMTSDEFTSRYLAPPRSASVSNVTNDVDPDPMSAYDEWDWRKHGAVAPVKNQGACGSCWSFSTTGSIEGQYAIKHKRITSLSEQMLVDCCTRANHGCKGGNVDKALDCVKGYRGIDTESSYNYTAKQGMCKFRTSTIGAKVTGYKAASGQSYLRQMVRNNGPASVYIYATAKLQHYRSGIFTDNSCETGHVNHAVLAVGYGNGYWIIKNSWGTRWGMSGYFKIKRGTTGTGMCMIAFRVIIPVVE